MSSASGSEGSVSGLGWSPFPAESTDALHEAEQTHNLARWKVP